jgi:hypothetical protein
VITVEVRCVPGAQRSSAGMVAVSQVRFGGGEYSGPGSVTVWNWKESKPIAVLTMGPQSSRYGWSVDVGRRGTGSEGSETVLAIGAPASEGYEKGAVRVVSCNGWETLTTIVDPEGKLGFGREVRIVADADGDRRADVAVGTSFAGDDYGGAVAVFSSSSGKRLWKAEGKAGECIGGDIACVQDIDGDGADDVVAGVERLDFLRRQEAEAGLLALAMSGKSGRVLWEYRGRTGSGSIVVDVEPCRDVDGDGKRDLLMNRVMDTSREYGVVPVKVVSGATGKPIRDLGCPWLEGGIAVKAVEVEDVNGDGVRDLAVRVADVDPLGKPKTQRVAVQCGRTGARLYWVGGGEGATGLGSSIEGCGDETGDGISDLVVCDWGDKVGIGRVLLVSGKDGAIVRTLGK